MMGHYGTGSSELAAVGIAGLLTWILLTFLWPLSTGVQALASRRFGRGDGDTGAVLDNGLIVAAAAGTVAIGISFIAPWPLQRLISSSEVYRLIMEYLGIIRVSLLPMGFFLVSQGFLGAINRTRPVMIAGLLSNLLNIALNWVLIFGRFHRFPCSFSLQLFTGCFPTTSPQKTVIGRQAVGNCQSAIRACPGPWLGRVGSCRAPAATRGGSLRLPCGTSRT